MLSLKWHKAWSMQTWVAVLSRSELDWLVEESVEAQELLGLTPRQLEKAIEDNALMEIFDDH